MPASKPVVLYSVAVIVVALFAGRFYRPTCPVEQPPPPDASVQDPEWGLLANLDRDGSVFTATAARGYHRVMRSVSLPQAGLYRVSVDTRFEGTNHMQIELAGSDQPYGIVTVNLRTGKVEKIEHDIRNAGVEQIDGEPGHYHWWVESQLNRGRLDYDFDLVSGQNGNLFSGATGICRMALLNPVVTDSTGVALH